MIYKKYGKTDLMVSAIGFGGMRFDTSKDKSQNADIVLHAVEKGINYLDTAPHYSDDQSEDIFGHALSQLASKRDTVYISTKGMPIEHDTADKARQAVEKSLSRLKVDYIDFYHVWCIRSQEQYEIAMKPGGQYEGLLQCKNEGLIKHIVISTHLPGKQIAGIIEDNKFEGILLGLNILNYKYRWYGVQAAYDSGHGVVAMNPLAGGVIPQNEAQLGYLSSEGESPTEAAIRFCVSCPQITVTLVGFTTCEHIDIACKVADTAKAFSQEDFDRIGRNVSSKMNALCTGCQYCAQLCPKSIPIPAYMLNYNDKLLLNKSDKEMIEKIKMDYQYGILVDKKAEACDCVECGRCEQACTQHLDIINRLRHIAAWEKEITS